MSNGSTSPYLVQSLLKRNLVNLAIGMSGAGKSKWITQMLRSMFDRRPFLNTYATTHPGRVHYVGLDRARPEIADLIHKAGLHEIPEFSWDSLRHRLREINKLSVLLALIPEDTDHLIIDGIGFVVDDIIKQRGVGCLFADLDNWIARRNGQATATLIHHTAKSKQGQGYASSREKGLGSGAWAQMSAVQVLIEAVNPFDVKDSRRTAYVTQNNMEGFSLPLRINSEGILEVDPDIIEFTREELRDLTGEEDRTLSRHIDQWIKEGLFERTANGHFRGRMPVL